MRFVVFGAGAIGGVVGARLAEHAHDVVLIARGKQYEAVRQHGLRVEAPDRVTTVALPVVDHPARIDWRADDVVLLTVKTQDTAAALRDLAVLAPPELPIVCMQNGVESERVALRLFTNVYGVCVICPTSYLRPGVVQAWATPTAGLLDIGRYPDGVDAVADTVAAAFRASTFESLTRADIMRWKYGKLLMNLGNAIEAICGPAARTGPLASRARREGAACLEAAKITYASEAEDSARRGEHLRLGTIGGQRRGGGSTWQSLQRLAQRVESDYLNGEVAFLGRLHGVPTPVNDLLQRVANQMARDGIAAGEMTPDDLLALLPPAER